MLAALLFLAGCGGSGDTASGSSTTAAATAPPQTMVGPRGERQGQEPATTLHVSRADCATLRKRAEAQTGRHLGLFDEPTPPSSRCRLDGPGVRIGVYLDSGRSARQRYKNRMTEQNQFGAPDPRKTTHPVANVGDPAPDNEFASWVPGLGTLFAARGNRWLTVTYDEEGLSSAAARDRAAELARLGFRLTAE